MALEQGELAALVQTGVENDDRSLTDIFLGLGEQYLGTAIEARFADKVPPTNRNAARYDTAAGEIEANRQQATTPFNVILIAAGVIAAGVVIALIVKGK